MGPFSNTVLHTHTCIYSSKIFLNTLPAPSVASVFLIFIFSTFDFQGYVSAVQAFSFFFLSFAQFCWLKAAVYTPRTRIWIHWKEIQIYWKTRYTSPYFRAFLIIHHSPAVLWLNLWWLCNLFYVSYACLIFYSHYFWWF